MKKSTVIAKIQKSLKSTEKGMRTSFADLLKEGISEDDVMNCWPKLPRLSAVIKEVMALDDKKAVSGTVRVASSVSSDPNIHIPDTYNVYRIEISKEIMEDEKFKAKNKKTGKTGMKCYYVGETGNQLPYRFLQHQGLETSKDGKNIGSKKIKGLIHKNAKIEGLKSGIKTRTESKKIEKEEAAKLRQAGYWVWTG